MSDTIGYKPIEKPKVDLAPPPPAPPPRSRLQRARLPLMIGVPAVIIAGALYFFLSAGRYQSTDDAYVKLARAGISTSVSGRVVSVAVQENQIVHKGDVLVTLDPADYQVALESAEASYAAARFEAEGLMASYRQRLADRAAAEETISFTAREAKRQADLAKAGVSTKGQADEAAHAAELAKAQQRVSEQQVASALASVGGDPDLPVEKFPGVMKAKADLDQARLNLGYATLKAPADGIVTKVDQVQPGTRVAASQVLFFLISGKPWIEANFKEDQLAHMKPGQPVTISVDAYDHDLTGHVTSFSPGTGSSFSLLPPENATGNWVKVVQRLPVKVEIDGDVPTTLSAGLSATVEVDTEGQTSQP